MDKVKQITQQLNKEYEDFLEKPYSGKGDMPDVMIEAFKKGVFKMAAAAHKIAFTKIRMLLSKEKKDLTQNDIEEIGRIVLNAPMDAMFNTIEEGIEGMVKVEQFIIKVNFNHSDFKNSLTAKRERMIKLSGTGPSIITPQ